jgi:hypothetical protein
VKNIIQAYIDGKAIEYREKGTDLPWHVKKPYRGEIIFYTNDFDFRIKPETHVRYTKCFKDGAYNTQFTDASPDKQRYHNLALTFENNVLTKAEVLNP